MKVLFSWMAIQEVNGYRQVRDGELPDDPGAMGPRSVGPVARLLLDGEPAFDEVRLLFTEPPPDTTGVPPPPDVVQWLQEIARRLGRQTMIRAWPSGVPNDEARDLQRILEAAEACVSELDEDLVRHGELGFLLVGTPFMSLGWILERERLGGRLYQADLEAGIRACEVSLWPRLERIVSTRRRIQQATSEGSGAPSGDQAEPVGVSPAFRRVLEQARLVARHCCDVLLLGETGTGKEILARYIHATSRPGKPFEPVNCAAIPPELFESELFGHEAGAFTGAQRARAGKFEEADGGTLFLDEIGDLPPALQPKFLRVLQERWEDGTFRRSFTRVGSTDKRTVDVRIIAATNRPLTLSDGPGSFREDLLHRINEEEILLPPLRERLECIPALVEHFVAKQWRRIPDGGPPPTVTEDALDLLRRQSWPGNIRQLERTVGRVLRRSGGGCLDRECFESALGDGNRTNPSTSGLPPLPPLPIDLDEHLDLYHRAILEGALSRSGGNKKRAAELLGLARSTYLSRLAKGKE